MESLRLRQRASIWRVAMVVLLCTVVVQAQPGAEPSTTLINRDAVVYSAVTGKVYAVDKAHSAVWIIGADGEAKSVKVGAGPEAIAVNTVTRKVYVASSTAANVSVLDGKTDAVVATVPTAARPYAIAVDVLANKVYVSNTFSNMLTVIDGATNAATNIKTGSADAIVVDAEAGKVYLLGYETDALTVLDTDSGALSKLSAGAMHLWGLALNRAAGKLYVTHVQDGNLGVVDLKAQHETTVPAGAIPSAVAVDAATGRVYVANYGSGTVTVVDGATDRVDTIVKVGNHPQAIAIDRRRDIVAVANTMDNTVSLIDGKTARVWKTLPAGEHPYALAVNEETQRIYVANLAANVGGKAFTVISEGVE